MQLCNTELQKYIISIHLEPIIIYYILFNYIFSLLPDSYRQDKKSYCCFLLPLLPLRGRIEELITDHRVQLNMPHYQQFNMYSLATGASSSTLNVKVWVSERWRPSALLNHSDSVVSTSD